MKCNKCSGATHCYHQHTESDVTERLYFCKVCGLVFKTIEKKCEEQTEDDYVRS